MRAERSRIGPVIAYRVEYGAVAGVEAHQAMLRMATALAKAGADLFCDGKLLDAARKEFEVSGPDLPT